MSRKFRVALLRSGVESNMDSLAWSFTKLQYPTQLFDITSVQSADEMISEFKKFDADLYITHNFYFFNSWGSLGEELEAWLHANSKPIVAWYWDNPLSSGSMGSVQKYIFGPFPQNILHLVIDRTWVSFLKDRGIPADYLPIATDERFSQFKCRSSWSNDIDLSFVGKPFTTVEDSVIGNDDTRFFFRKHFLEEINYFLTERNDLFQLDDSALSKIVDNIENQISILFLKDVNIAHDYEATRNTIMHNLRSLVTAPVYKFMLIMLGRLDLIYSWCQQTRYIQELEPLGIKVFGGEEWGEFFLKSNQTSTRRLSDLELLECFSRSKISFCYTKWQFLEGVHERPFMVSALGGFALTDQRAGLQDIFRGNEIATYENIGDAIDKINFYLKNDSERNRIAARARERVLKDHTYTVRASQIIEKAKNWLGL